MNRVKSYCVLFLIGIFIGGCVNRSGKFYLAELSSTGTNFLLVAMQAASGNGSVVCFEADLTSLILEHKSTTTVGENPRDVEKNWNGRQIFVANYTSGTLTVYDFNRSTCELSLIQTVTGLTQITSLAINSSYQVLYAGYASGVQRYTIASDGTLTASGAVTSPGGAVQDMILSPSDHALYVNKDNDAIFTYSISTGGALSSLGSVGFTTLSSLDVNSNLSNSTAYLFATDTGLDIVRVFSINATTGALTLVDTESVTDPQAVRFYYAAPTSVYVQMSTGTLRVYTQASDGTLSLYYTNSEVSDTMVSASSLANVSLYFFSIGNTGGIYSWQHSVETSGISMRYRRATSLAGYGQNANSLLGVVVQ